jgi:hypothetical protein
MIGMAESMARMVLTISPLIRGYDDFSDREKSSVFGSLRMS